MIDIRKVFYSILLVATLIISYYLTTGIYNTVNNANIGANKNEVYNILPFHSNILC